MNVDDLVRKKKLSQTEFAVLVNVNQATISKALTDGILTAGADWITWNRELLRHSMEVSAGRKGTGPLDLAQERARLAKLQADRVAAELKEKLGEVLHIEPIAIGLGEVFSGVKNKLLSLAYKIKSRVPYIEPKDVSIIDDVVREVLLDIAESQLPKEVLTKIEELDSAEWAKVAVDRRAILNGSMPNHEVKKNAEKNGRPTKTKTVEETRA